MKNLLLTTFSLVVSAYIDTENNDGTCIRHDLVGDVVKNRPYSSAEFFLEGEGITFHHILPKRRLSDIWNLAACLHPDKLAPIVNAISSNLLHFGYYGGDKVPDFPKFLQLNNPNFKSDSSYVNPVRRAFMWPPGNLMHGPNPDRRIGDPHEDFEHELCWSMGCASKDVDDVLSKIPICSVMRAAYHAGIKYLINKNAEDITRFATLYSVVLGQHGNGGSVNPLIWDTLKTSKSDGKEHIIPFTDTDLDGLNSKASNQKKGKDLPHSPSGFTPDVVKTLKYTVNGYGKSAFMRAQLCKVKPGIVSGEKGDYPVFQTRRIHLEGSKEFVTTPKNKNEKIRELIEDEILLHSDGMIQRKNGNNHHDADGDVSATAVTFMPHVVSVSGIGSESCSMKLLSPSFFSTSSSSDDSSIVEFNCFDGGIEEIDLKKLEDRVDEMERVENRAREKQRKNTKGGNNSNKKKDHAKNDSSSEATERRHPSQERKNPYHNKPTTIVELIENDTIRF